MPTDRIEIRKGHGHEPDVWQLRGIARQFGEPSLFTGEWGALRPADLIDKLPVEFDVTHDGKLTNIRRYPPLPVEIRKLVALHGCSHPGLALDKYVYRYDDQNMAKASLHAVAEVNQRHAASQNGAGNFEMLRKRRAATIGQLTGLDTFRCTTTGPLTLHLARAGALENAGICLHPLYGFVYLPGTGLKGMARAYAEIIWLAGESDQSAGWQAIEKVFGWAPGSDRIDGRDKPWKPPGARAHGKSDAEHAGDIVFHDAWPAKWPELIVDIVNNHHPKYYEASDNSHPPGDWENPIPVYFLAISAGNSFEFALSKRRDDIPDADLDHAREWLLGALCHLGAGAKTAAGYGGFRPEPETVAVPKIDSAANKVMVFETQVELVTPAFLAGASQTDADCDLRPATLRGLLRWWWRTLHAGHVDVKTLREMEAAVWGSVDTGSPLRVEISRAPDNKPPQQYSKRHHANFTSDQKSGEYGITGIPPNKTTQGLWYISFGMDDSGRQRHFLSAGARWTVRLTARATVSDKWCAKEILDQAVAALSLLCSYGGVGSKARKGFGSLRAGGLQAWTRAHCESVAAELRLRWGLTDNRGSSASESPALSQALPPVEVAFNWPDVWSVLDQVGFACQAFAKNYKHQREKCALGLPRRIGSPANGRFSPQGDFGKFYEDERRQRRESNVRHSSPVHLHLDGDDKTKLVRVLALPAAGLPDLATSTQFLQKLLDHLKSDLERRAALGPPSGQPPLPQAPRPRPGEPTARQSFPAKQFGPATVRVKFLGPHAGLKAAFWVQESGKRKGLVKYGKPPEPLPAEGQEIEVYPTNVNPQSPEYRWDRPPAPPPPSRGGRPRGRS